MVVVVYGVAFVELGCVGKPFASLGFRLLKWRFRSSISPLSSGLRFGAFVGGAIISIFGFCSSNKQ